MGNKTDILNSRKEVADYLEKDMRTCLRWEKKLGLPVHRYDSSSTRSKVFAYKSEIDRLLLLRTNSGSGEEKTWLSRLKKIAWPAVFLVFLILSGLHYFAQRPSPIERFPTLAVFPFENIDPALTEKYFSESMTHEIIDHFINSTRLRVIPAASTRNRSPMPSGREKIGANLGADYFLQAKVDKDINHVSLDAELLRAKDGKIVWQKHSGRCLWSICGAATGFSKSRLNTSTHSGLR
jgi:TolB-like protein